jgi:hypothetical protein
MGWFADLFNSGTTARKGQALNSTHDAFALPTHSPSFGTTARTDPYNPQASDTDPSSAYTYPPPSSTRQSFDYVPSPYVMARYP